MQIHADKRAAILKFYTRKNADRKRAIFRRIPARRARRTGVGMKSAYSFARSDNSIQRHFAKKILFSSKMAELIVRVHETVASYIANAEDKSLATAIGNEFYNFQEPSSNITRFPNNNATNTIWPSHREC